MKIALGKLIAGLIVSPRLRAMQPTDDHARPARTARKAPVYRA